MSKFWSPIVHQLTPYVPGEQPKISNLIKLNTNENPYGPSPKVLNAIEIEAGNSLRLYSDPTSERLVNAIAQYYQLDAKQIFVGNGSDEVLAHTFQALFQHGKPLLFPDITYSFYPVYCKLYGVEAETIPLNTNFEVDLSDYIRPNSGIIFPNPNAPTGHGIGPGAIEMLLKKNLDSVVVVDEAYIDFGGESAVTLINEYPNLLVIQTFSKSRSLAGLRVGFAMGSEALIAGLIRVKDSFNSYPLDSIAISGAVAAIQDKVHFEYTRKRIITSREQLTVELEALGFNIIPSQANFLFVTHPQHDAADLAADLRVRNIIVRYFNKPRIDQYLRITIGTDDECAMLVSALQDIVKD
ncbi:Histidinol-phosphate aminotransferase [hydrothermal vent metagenome]|uniref:Histidinol-phosphate aminotransferase n=1 Tax=hydrothermal vent metagenome TaxID=652676 RepID=A0A3B0Z2K8_9ZZZZ